MAVELEWSTTNEYLRLADEEIPISQIPDVPEHLYWVWRAYHRLDLDRPWISGGMAAAIPCRIRWNDIMVWCDRHEYDDDDRTMLDACIIAMDSEYLKYHNKRQAQQAGQK